MAGTLKATLIHHSTQTQNHPTIMQQVNTNHIANLNLTKTHELWQCPEPCNDRRWIHKDAWDAQSVSKPSGSSILPATAENTH